MADPQAPASIPAAPAPQAQQAQQAPVDTTKLVDREGNIVDVPTSQAAQAVASGQLGWLAGSTVPVVDPSTGIARSVPAEEASKHLAGGATLGTSAQARDLALEQEYGGALGHGIGAVERLASGATAGLTDLAAVEGARAFGGEKAAAAVAQHLSGHKEALGEGASAALEITGAVAPLLFGDVQGVAGILGSVPRGIGGAGKLAANLTERLVGAGAESLLGRVGQKAITEAANAMVQGALWSAGSEISSASLQNRGLVADNIIGAAGHGALVGGVLGGALGAAEPLVGKAWESIASKVPGGKFIGEQADEQYIRAISANKKSFLEQMKDRFGGKDATSRIANRLRTEGIVEAGDDIEKIAAKAVKAEGSAIEELANTVDRVGAKGVTIEDAVKGLEERAKQFDNMLNYNSAAAAVRQQGKNIADIYGPRALQAAQEAGITEPALVDKFFKEYQIPIRDLLDQRRKLEGTINWNTDTVVSQGTKAAGRTLEDVIMNAGENAAKEAGDDLWRADYLAAKTRFAENRFIRDVTEDAVTAKLRNRLISPSDYGAMMLGGILGGAGGEAEGGHGGGVMGALTGMIMGAAHHQIRQRGNATAAVLLDKLGTMAGLSEMQVGATNRLDSIISGALKRGARKEALREMKKVDFSEERFDKEAKRVQDLGAHSGLDAHLASRTAALAGHAPEVADAVKQKSVAAVRFLNSKLPAEYLKTDQQPTLTPNLKPTVSKVAMTKFLRAADAVNKGPEAIVKDALSGAATLDEIEALREVFPDYYQDAQERVQLACASKTSPIPFQTAVNLGILFDTPTLPCLAPDMIQQEQKMYAQMAPPPGPPPPGGGKKGSRTKPLKIATMSASMFESGLEDKK